MHEAAFMARVSDGIAHFFKAVRARDPKMLNGEIEEGHISSAYCHLANISYRLGSEVPFDKPTKAFGDHPYGRQATGTLESVPTINVADLRDYTGRVIARDTLRIAVVEQFCS